MIDHNNRMITLEKAREFAEARYALGFSDGYRKALSRSLRERLLSFCKWIFAGGQEP